MKRLKNLIIRILAKLGKTVISLDPRIASLTARLRDDVDLCISFHEAQMLISLVKATNGIGGDLAEVGTYKGGSAAVICEYKPDQKILHLFDTWEGHPEPIVNVDDAAYYKGKCYAKLEDAKEYLKKYPNVLFYKGLFSETVSSVADRRFAFVHLDGDLYDQAKEGLEFFYPRMHKGGIILLADYPRLSGVRKAAGEFLEKNPEPIIQLASDLAIIIKT